MNFASRVPVRDAATTSFYAAQKYIPYENTFGQTWRKWGGQQRWQKLIINYHVVIITILPAPGNYYQ